MIKLIIIATFYANSFVGKPTASGEIFSQHRFTCATRMFPLGARLMISNISNGRTVEVKVNDRCAKHGIVDLSKVAFKEISDLKYGRAKVTVVRKN